MELTLRRVPQARMAPVIVLAVIVLALVLVAIAVVGSRRHVPPPFGIATNGQIAFTYDGKFVIENADGTASRTVLSQSNGQVSPAYSLDGTKIAYKDIVATGLAPDRYSNTFLFDVVVANADGSHPIVLAHDVAVGNPIWSPDGRWISYTTNDGSVYVAASDGSGVSDLGKVGGSAWTPSWSPDSTKLAVATDSGVLWLVNRDGTGARPISKGHYQYVGQKGWSADWNPGGTELAFMAGAQNDQSDVYLVGLDGAPERLVAPDGQNPVWSPDGSMIAFLRHSGTGLGPSLVITDRDFRSFRTMDGYYGWYMPAWSPDQRQIAILDDQPGPANLPGPPVITLIDVSHGSPVGTIPAGSVALTPDTQPDYTLTWQRLAP